MIEKIGVIGGLDLPEKQSTQEEEEIHYIIAHLIYFCDTVCYISLYQSNQFDYYATINLSV